MSQNPSILGYLTTVTIQFIYHERIQQIGLLCRAWNSEASIVGAFVANAGLDSVQSTRVGVTMSPFVILGCLV